jgi:hypothetical protein
LDGKYCHLDGHYYHLDGHYWHLDGDYWHVNGQFAHLIDKQCIKCDFFEKKEAFFLGFTLNIF